MARKDYEQIKEGFIRFLEGWRKKDTKLLDTCVVPETKCYLSTVEKYPCGSQHGIFGVRNFVIEVSEPDFFHIVLCNFVVKFYGEKAQQSATAVCRVGKYDKNDVKILEFSALFANQWKKTAKGWRVCDMKMDILECSGDYTEFIDKWYFEKQDLMKYYFGIHLPVVSGELDSPWNCIPQAEQVLTNEEQILETFSRYAFGIDTLDFTQLTEALSEDLVVNMPPWGAMDKREFMNTLKFKRMASRHWNHPASLDEVQIDGNKASLQLYRMAGHKQSDYPVILNKDNAETAYACARYKIKMRKEKGEWKILRMDYFLGTIELGKFEVEITAK